MTLLKRLSTLVLPIWSLSLLLFMLGPGPGAGLPAFEPQPAAAAPASPAATWSTPIDVSQDKIYGTAPSIAADAGGGVDIAWELRQQTSPSYNSIMVAMGANGTALARSEVSHSTPQKSSGSVHILTDSLGRRHLVWYQYEGSTVCDYYARIEVGGHVSIKEKVPGSCGLGLKNTALTLGPNNTAHMLFGQNLKNILYWVRDDKGWTVQGERIPNTSQPEHLTIGVTTGGVVMVGWKDVSPRGYTDIYLASRKGANNWGVDDLSASLSPGCGGNSRTYFPWLAADPSGGMRISWVDEHCTPRNPPPQGPQGDIYYREWTPSAGWYPAPVLVEGGHGDAFQDLMVVDGAGLAHIVWVDQSNFSVWYASGRGTSFTQAQAPFNQWARGSEMKDIGLDYNSGTLFLAFTSNRDDPLKEIYYSTLRVASPPPAPAPTATPVPTAAPPASLVIPGADSTTFPETGKTMTGVFLDYWQQHGALAQQGFPVSGLVSEKSPLNGKSYIEQYTERAVFEYHPENQPPYNVLLSQLGTFRYKARYPNGAPNQTPNTSAGSVLFAETGKRVGGRFLDYWQSRGGLMQQGFPISDEFTETSATDGKPYLVQYFERAVFELHPSNQVPYDVLLSLLGVFQYRDKYGR